MKKKYVVSSLIIGCALLVGFQVAQDLGLHLLQSPGAVVKDYVEPDYGLGSGHVDSLKPFPKIKKGERTPFDLWNYAGKGKSSFMDPNLPMEWNEWLAFHNEQKPQLMKDIRTYMDSRYDFNGETYDEQYMSGGRKAIMKGPIARLPKGISSYEQLAKKTPEEIKQKDLFPFKPLAHPLASTAHMVFPDSWNLAHPEHLRIDLDHDYPDEYLPEFPPPMFLTTHKELGDVTKGKEITLSNYYEIFNGLLTPEQMEGLKELLRPTPTTWFNQTTHRVTPEPSA
ncbi:MAG: cytochrome C, partial [Maribacter sp.]|nr:cytochrome C [Maribacter sp.]